MHSQQTTVLNAIASALVALGNCIKSGNTEQQGNWETRLANLAKFALPTGSGFDCGTKIDADRSDGETRIVLTTSFHHMNENGMYDGWTEHAITVRPNLLHGFTLSIGGRDRNQWKEYAYDVFNSALDAEIVIWADGRLTPPVADIPAPVAT